MNSYLMKVAAAAFLLVAGLVGQAAELQQGKPKIQSIDVISFSPDGVLLVGDGKSAQVVLIDTKEKEVQKWTAQVADLKGKVAQKLGITAKDLEMIHFASHPKTGKAFIAVRRQDNKKEHLITVDGNGEIKEFSLDNVAYKTVSLPKGSGGSLNKITDLAWSMDRLLVSGVASEEFACKLFCVYTPLEKQSDVILTSAETFHVAHNKWETKAPMTVLMPYEEDGKKYLVGAFSCTPLVKYPLDAFTQDAKVKGQSVVELGSGNKPLHMFTYKKDGKTYVLVNTFRFHHQRKPFGPSPYWTARIDIGVISENSNINEKALKRLDGKGEPGTEKVKMIPEFHGVSHMDKLGDDKALVIQEDDKGVLTLKALQLP